jgi:hypothetical protein
MARYTITNLRADIAEINGWLAEADALVRFEECGRNGYQAVDEYEVDETGQRIGSGCTRNIGCGTSREVHGYAYEAYQGIIRNLETERKVAS